MSQGKKRVYNEISPGEESDKLTANEILQHSLLNSDKYKILTANEMLQHSLFCRDRVNNEKYLKEFQDVKNKIRNAAKKGLTQIKLPSKLFFNTIVKLKDAGYRFEHKKDPFAPWYYIISWWITNILNILSLLCE